MLHHAHAPNSLSANPSELSAESPLSQPAAARHLSSTSTSSSTSAATANPNSLLNSAANTDNSHGGVVRRAPASLVTAAVPHPLILSDFCHGSHVSHRRAASDRAVLSASDADSIWTHNPAVPPTDQWTSELTSLQQTTELNRSSQEKVAARIRRSGSLMDMKAYPKQFQQQHEFLQPVKHGKYDSGSSTGSGNDLIDEAGTLFNFDEDNELLEEPITNLTVDYLPDRSEKRTLSFDGSVETGSDAYTWVGSLNEQQQIYSATRNSLESKWKSPNYALGGGSSSLRSPQSNFGEPHNESQDYAVSRQLVSPSISGLNGHMNGSHINSRRSVMLVRG
ncbi:hypothetical protein BCR33DRAFT_320024 [Rhizoclosmatium globosum]|uniref:Uncharacterized protein n=1 Tax=Rhizoclosmatium globosum TaxID=329046 RepID=A0A1Y2CZV9_9FUNG|nr:hypothetical protein BCR33DRAFT_320024 [Rhizoclosmatium globosum]|eukprot:ORY52540.1 hypothetical protein BCR33DRAFT_320024 [Rhizoclosmatium globosum]